MLKTKLILKRHYWIEWDYKNGVRLFPPRILLRLQLYMFLVPKLKNNPGGILYNSYFYRLKRLNNNGAQKCFCTRNSCSCLTTIKDDVIIGSSDINDNGTHYPVHDPKLSKNVLYRMR
ncbi:unnamed protein product [Didymodactylos carnosus]|uniref:FLYWCH-type domain-containing protein n=1 Tax=Didymodactylos carnosus TaxID=1234261 RepID=A0A815GSL8_9BILA|nr:unnamed protein product [Didymodactylos carnosus]CAF4204552.1 unnamed protein product [Didymodactylos carnosus]